MLLSALDWTIIAIYFVVSLIIGLVVSKRSGKSASEFFLSGRTMPWWLLGISMVATTFSADTPNLVTDLVRKDGVAGNWAWWAFLLTGMLTVFVYARLWRRSGVLTDMEFYELRYSGKEAAFLRGFRAIYLGVFFNVVIMATVCLAAVKIGSVMLGLSPGETLLIACIITVVYSAIGGYAGVLWTDFFQFILAMIGAIWAAIEVLSLPAVGGLDNLIAQTQVAEKISMFPDFSKPEQYVPLLIVPLAVQWWSVWYPGAEPGGGGYIAQRMLSAKDEKNAVGATLLFNIAHYALRPWPWIIVALASLVVYPTLADLQIAFPNVPADTIGHDLAYPAMLTLMPTGLKGIIMASLMAAFMSTIATHLNWGSSYIVNDVYKRFINKDASDKMQVNVGRISTVVLMALGGLLSVFIGTAAEGFNLLLSIGAGTGLIFILRWFWWRISAYSEIAGMVISFVVALSFFFIKPEWPAWVVMVVSVGITTIGWFVVTFITPPTAAQTLANFYTKIKPYGTGWKKFAPDYSQKNNKSLGTQVMCMFIGCITVYSALFATGFFIYGNVMAAVFLALIAMVGGYSLFALWKKTLA
ncbi:MAG: sodium:solute symporter family protein [Flavobacteriales bacterium]|nr:sodium:solute symporter family protein [Flavobacteriales bacterium]